MKPGLSVPQTSNLSFISVSHVQHQFGEELVDAVKKYFEFTSRDILIFLFWAHTQDEKTERIIFTDFVNVLNRRIMNNSRSHSFWIEPIPQHFSNGSYNFGISHNDNFCPTTVGCCPMTSLRNSTQFWRVDVVRSILGIGRTTTIVPAYDGLTSAYECHTHSKDCTHYNLDAYLYVLKQLYTVMKAKIGNIRI
jgi:hypothetical protein